MIDSLQESLGYFGPTLHLQVLQVAVVEQVSHEFDRKSLQHLNHWVVTLFLQFLKSFFSCYVLKHTCSGIVEGARIKDGDRILEN